ncbi:MAG: transposase family protein, partial [Verrucomicrobiota bacterium]
MSPEKLFGELLGLGLSWRVAECVFSRSEGRVDLRVENTEEVWKTERCPRCGGLPKAYDHTEEVYWDHLHVMQFRCQITARLPRGRCDQCNHTWRVRPPWEGKAGGFSKDCETFALLLMREMPIRKAAEVLGEVPGGHTHPAGVVRLDLSHLPGAVISGRAVAVPRRHGDVGPAQRGALVTGRSLLWPNYLKARHTLKATSIEG